MDFPSRLKRLRNQHRLTQEQLGNKVNVTKVSISGYENGNRSPDIETLQKLADVLDSTVDYLLGRSDDIQTIAAHHDGEEWTEEELKTIEEFKAFVKSQRMRKNKE